MFRSPFLADVVALRDTIDGLVNETFGPDRYRTVWSRSGNGGSVAQPLPLDVYATDEQAVIIAAIPGMAPDDLQLTVQANTVTLQGTVGTGRKHEEAQNATWYMQELWSGQVRRSVTLPFPVDADAAEATFEHGILRVVLPKAESAKPRRIAISGSAGQTAISANSGQQS